MQIALPIGLPIDRNALGVRVLLLAGISVLPLTSNPIISYSERLQSNEFVRTDQEWVDKRNFNPMVLNSSESYVMPSSRDLKNEVMKIRKFTKEQTAGNIAAKELNWQEQASVQSTMLNRGSSPLELTEQIINSAKTWIGVPYLYGGTTRQGVDCSALVQNIYKGYGVELPRTSQEQFRTGVGVPLSQLIPGDLVFFSTSGPGASHVGIYIGNQEFVSATRNKVEIQSIDKPYWSRTYRGSRRVIN
jgi:cell wall-associated NlpC family hydrolase